MMEPHHSDDRGETTAGGHAQVFVASIAHLYRPAVEARMNLLINVYTINEPDLRYTRRRR